MNKAFFLDRDGVVIEQVHYLKNPDEVKLIDGVAEAFARLRASGWLVVVITNQSGVGRGYFTMEDVEKVHTEMRRQLLAANPQATVDGIYVCPHAPGEDCPCRKPKPELILRAARTLDIDVSQSVMAGDKLSDVECGKNAGCRLSCLVQTGYGAKEAQKPEAAGVAVYRDLPALAAAVGSGKDF